MVAATDNRFEDRDGEDSPTRGADGKFLAGAKSANPAGRPRGLSHSEKVRVLLEPHRETLIERSLALTQSDDPHASVQALKLCLQRLAPIPKDEAERVYVPGLSGAATFSEKCEAVIKAVADGDISAEAGERLLRLLDIYRRALAHDELERRVAALEGRKIAALELSANSADADDSEIA